MKNSIKYVLLTAWCLAVMFAAGLYGLKLGFLILISGCLVIAAELHRLNNKVNFIWIGREQSKKRIAELIELAEKHPDTPLRSASKRINELNHAINREN